MCQHAELTVPRQPGCIRAGRHFVADTLARWGVVDDDPARQRVDDIVLVASELLANAVHASTDTAELRIEAHRDHVLVAVRDDSQGRALPRAAGLDDTSGRGLVIVRALSERWGSTTSIGPGKVVWSTVAIDRGSVLAARCRL